MRVRIAVVIGLLAGMAATGTFTTLADDRNGALIRILDDCLPGDPLWNPTGGCTLNPTQGDVSVLEFRALLTAPTLPTNVSPAGVALVGHPSWRAEPSHVTVNDGKTLHFVNDGGRDHTFTKVANFGGGYVGGLNVGLAPAPECTPGTTLLLHPGEREEKSGLAPGLHKFMCCIHPWMRATVRVEE